MMTIPTRMSVERALVVECGGALYGFPARDVIEVVHASAHSAEQVVGGEVVRYRDQAIPLRSLSAAVAHQREAEPWALILDGEPRWALTVPALLGDHELVRQPIDRLLHSLQHIGASATLDDGRMVLLVTLAGLLRQTEGIQPKHKASGSRPAARRVRALVVDDSEVIRDLVAQILRASGLEVETAPEGRSALALIEARPPDIVIADVEMPIMNGFELLEQIRARTQKLPVVLLTSRGSPEDRRRAATLGANAHLIKSGFGEASLLETIRRFVDVPRA
jgi:CheY-like chemotaxis protein